MSTSVETILLYTIGAGFLSIVYGFLTGKNILNLSAGNAKMQEIASAIQIGAKAYLARQYKTIAIVGVVVLVIVSFAFSPLVGLGYLIGATLSGIAGYVGMLVSVQANVRTTEASRKGLAQGLSVAFKSGAVTGMLVAGLALLAIAVYYYILLKFNVDEREIVNALVALGFGASLISIFARLGGGIFTKGADVGADLVGKVEAGIPEDDPRNPAVIADNVGDNVGDCAGMAADLFETYAVTIVATMVLSSIFFVGDINMMIYPLTIGGACILTSIVGTFFVKDYLNLSAAFLAVLGFWAGIPWALKMPLGHLVDLIWNKKNYMVYLGASLIALSLLIMYGLIIHTKEMSQILKIETWFVISVIIAPVGYVIQDVVADAMTLEAVPLIDDQGKQYSKDQIKIMHTTMQTLGRFAIIGGTVLVALANVILFRNVESLDQVDKIQLYGSIYIYALIIPLISIFGVILSNYLRNNKIRNLKIQGLKFRDERGDERPKVNWWILGGSLIFVIFSLSVGSFKIPYAQEIVFTGSVIIMYVLRLV